MGRYATICVILLVMTSGCSLLPGVGPGNDKGATVDQPRNSATLYQAQTINVEPTLIALSDLPQEYSPSGVSQTNVTETDSSEKVLLKEERVFKLNATNPNDSLPFYAFSGVILYDTNESAKDGVNQLLQQNLTSQTQFSVASGDRATLATFNTGPKYQATIAVSSHKNLVYYVVLVGPSKYGEMAENLLTRMYVNLP